MQNFFMFQNFFSNVSNVSSAKVNQVISHLLKSATKLVSRLDGCLYFLYCEWYAYMYMYVDLICSSSSSNLLGKRPVALVQTQQQYNTLSKNTFETKQNSSSWDSRMRLPNSKSFKNKICKVKYSSSIVIRHELYKFMHIWSFKIIFRYVPLSQLFI